MTSSPPSHVSTNLPWRHALLALAIVAVWGTNFVVIKVGLAQIPPMTFATLRFVFVLAPAVFFIKRPQVAWSNLAVYGGLTGAGQFGLLYVAMQGHISPGLASLVLQIQVFFTIGLAARLSGERVRGYQLAALGLGALGIGVIAAHASGATTPFGLFLVLIAALSWAIANITVRRAGQVNMLGYVVWSSLFAIPPLVVLSLVLEGPSIIAHDLLHAGPAAWGAVLWQSVGNTMFGYAAWGWLLARHPAATVTPMSMLVPVFGMAASTLVLAEPLPGWKLGAAGLVLGGLTVNVLWPTIRRRMTRTAISVG